MESRKREVEGQTEDGPTERDPVRSGDAPDGQRRAERTQSLQTAGGAKRVRGSLKDRDLSSWVGWQAALYTFVVGAVCLVLVPLTSLWWIIPVLGALAPITLAVLRTRGLGTGRPGDRKAREGELLEALAERGEITPVAAAMRTSLTVDEALKMLDELAEKGHLRLHMEDGSMAYAFPERDRRPERSEPHALSRAEQESVGPSKPLDDPLSERELEVLALLASGRTNAEIARDLFVALGTVKSHVNNIYRKLDAANRAEAVTRARDLNLLR